MLQELRGDDGKIVKMFFFQPPGLFSLAWAGGDSDDPEVNLQMKYTEKCNKYVVRRNTLVILRFQNNP